MRRLSVDTLVFGMRYIITEKAFKCNAFCNKLYTQAIVIDRYSHSP